MNWDQHKIQDVGILLGTLALVGVWWWTLARRANAINYPDPAIQPPSTPKLTKREEFLLTQKNPVVPLDISTQRRHTKYGCFTIFSNFVRILAARPVTKKKEAKKKDDSSDEDIEKLYKIDDGLPRKSNKSLYSYSYTSDEVNTIPEEDKDQVN